MTPLRMGEEESVTAASKARKEAIRRRTEALKLEQQQKQQRIQQQKHVAQEAAAAAAAAASEATPTQEAKEELTGSALLALHRSSVRWLYLSSTFWSIVVYDAQRIVNKEEMINFYKVMKWRLHNEISGEEFSSLTREWMNYKSKVSNLRTDVMSITALRQILLDDSCTESDLDLLIGIVLNETNRIILNSPIGYRYDVSSSSNLDVCSHKWLSLSEELFFLLDSPGYGSIGFDETFFFTAALVIGTCTKGNRSMSEVEDALSLRNVGILTLQIIREAGATFNTFAKSDTSVGNRTSIGALPVRKYAITLTMFKYLLIRKGIGELALSRVLSHVQWFLKNTVSISELYNIGVKMTFSPLENRLELGSPRLWQHSVCSVVGMDPRRDTKLPPIVLYLLSDAERLIPASARIYEDNSSNEKEMHETSIKICKAFKLWSGAEDPQMSRPAGVAFSDKGVSDGQQFTRNPVYQLLITAVHKYKQLQRSVMAVVHDIGMDVWSASDGTLATSTNLACELLLPLKTEKLEAELFDSSFTISSSTSLLNAMKPNITTKTVFDDRVSGQSSNNEDSLSDQIQEKSSGTTPSSVETGKRYSTSGANNDEINGSSWPSLLNRSRSTDTANSDINKISGTVRRKSIASGVKESRESSGHKDITKSPMNTQESNTTNRKETLQDRRSDRSDSPSNRMSAVTSPVDSSGNSVGSGSKTVYTDLSASTIADLLDQGQSIGKYAQSLREILRKMSRDESDVKLHSLQKIMELGESISAKAPVPAVDTSPQGVVRSMPNFRSPGKSKIKNESTSPRLYEFSHPVERTSTFRVPIKSTYDPNASVRYKAPRSSRKTVGDYTLDSVDRSQLVSGIKTKERRVVPGTTPQDKAKRNNKANANLVFGHPLD